MRKKLICDESGAMMVEATIYIPIVILIVVALLQIALFNMQEYLMMYEAQRVASIVSRNHAYTGYKVFDMGQNNEIDFSTFPSSDQVESYYLKYHEDLASMYREIGGLLAGVGISEADTSAYEDKYSDAATQASLITIGTVGAPDVKIKSNLFGAGVTVEFVHEIPVPGLLKALGYQGNTTIRTTAYNYAVNPGEFARNVNLATDLVDYILEKLGLSGGFNDFKSQLVKVLDFVLGG